MLDTGRASHTVNQLMSVGTVPQMILEGVLPLLGRGDGSLIDSGLGLFGVLVGHGCGVWLCCVCGDDKVDLLEVKCLVYVVGFWLMTVFSVMKQRRGEK